MPIDWLEVEMDGNQLVALVARLDGVGSSALGESWRSGVVYLDKLSVLEAHSLSALNCSRYLLNCITSTTATPPI
jgi:hypothetical protein